MNSYSHIIYLIAFIHNNQTGLNRLKKIVEKIISHLKIRYEHNFVNFLLEDCQIRRTVVTRRYETWKQQIH